MVTGAPLSAADVADAVGLAHAAASYHLRQLASAGFIEPVDEPAARGRAGRPRRLYRMRDEAFQGFKAESSALLNRTVISELERRLQEAAAHHKTVDAEVWIAPEDWDRVVELVDQASEIVHKRALAPGTLRSKHIAFTTLLFDLG